MSKGSFFFKKKNGPIGMRHMVGDMAILGPQISPMTAPIPQIQKFNLLGLIVIFSALLCRSFVLLV